MMTEELAKTLIVWALVVGAWAAVGFIVLFLASLLRDFVRGRI